MTVNSSVKQEYDAQAAIYDGYMDRPSGVIERQLFTAALGNCTGLTVLDLGGGTGLKAREAADAGASAVDVIDLSPEMMRVGRDAEQAGPRRGKDILRWYEGDVTSADLVETLPGLRGPYDLVIVGWTFDHAHNRAQLEAMWHNAVVRLKPSTGRLLVVRNGDPRSPAVTGGRYGIRYAGHVPIPGGFRFRDQMIRWGGGGQQQGTKPDQFEILADYETTALEVMYSGSHEMYHQFGLTDIRTQPYEETAAVRADPAFWAQFLENPCLAVVTARKMGKVE
uniref:LolM n=1 Tax=Epichloe festucae TaxID=35717 RepID=G1APN9_9HYPO|nr:putative methyltransferase [Epichloe festucae]AER26965.1 LolM [Epichloe festucae]